IERMVRAAVEDEALRACASCRAIVPSSWEVSRSATVRATMNALEVSDADRVDAVVERRQEARKLIQVALPAGDHALAEVLASNAWMIVSSGQRACRVIVFVDSRKVAEKVGAAILKLAKGDGSGSKIDVEIELFVGGRRVAEREQAAKRLVELGLIA